MNRILALLLTLFTLPAFAGERVISNPDSNGDIKIKVKVGATDTTAIQVAGATGATTINGPLRHNNAAIGPAILLQNTATGITAGDGMELGGNSAGNSFWVWVYENGPLRFATNGTESGSIAADGAWITGRSTNTTSANLFHTFNLDTTNSTSGSGITMSAGLGGLRPGLFINNTTQSKALAIGTAANGGFISTSDTISFVTSTLAAVIDPQDMGGNTSTTLMTLTSPGLLSIGNNNVTAGTKLYATGNDGTGQAVVLFENRDTTVDATTRMVELSFDSDVDASNGRFMVFRDNDTSPMGTIVAASATTVAYNTTSDARLKTNVRPFPNALNTLMKVGTYEFDWIEDGHNDRGYLAQQLKSVYPFAVTGSENDGLENPMSVDYGKVTPLIVAGVQEQQGQIEEMRAMLLSLKSEFEAYKASHP